MAESRKSATEIKSLAIVDAKAAKSMQEKTSQEYLFEECLGRYKESEKPAPCITSDVVKLERLSAPESSPTNVKMPCLDKDDRKVEKTKQEKSLDEDLYGYKESEKPMECRTSDAFCSERLPDPESSLTPCVTPNVEMTYMHKTGKKEQKYLEIIDDVMVYKENVSGEGPHESRAEEPMSLTFVKFKPKRFSVQEGTSVSAVTKNINIEMTYLHKKDEEKVDKYRYMTLDEDRKRREDMGRYKSLSVPCMSSVNARESHSASGASPASENLNTDDEYDQVMTENENSSDPEAGGYDEPEVVNSERPPVPTGGEIYQELQ